MLLEFDMNYSQYFDTSPDASLQPLCRGLLIQISS